MIGEIATQPRRARRTTIAGLVLGAVAAATAVATAGPASATANTRDMGVRIWSMPTGATPALAATGQASTVGGVRTAAVAAASLEWMDVVSVVGGARVRAIPINGRILRLIPYGGRASALCRLPANDGYDWTWVSYAGVKGYVRNDLISPVQYTYPGAPPFRPVPRC